MEKRCGQRESVWCTINGLSKVFDCLPHELIITKLNAYGFKLPAVKLMHSYFPTRKQHTRVNYTYSSWDEILFGVPQGSILSTLYSIL